MIIAILFRLGKLSNRQAAQMAKRRSKEVHESFGTAILRSCTWKFGCQNRDYVQEGLNVQCRVKEETPVFEARKMFGQPVQPLPS